jgi:RNA polymerase sigma-70 factor (ECF subfamily)
MLLNDARREARFAECDVVLLRDQDRSLWDAASVAAGRVSLDRALALGGRGAYVHATRAELLRRLDRAGEARAAYGRALELVHSDAERRFLERRLAELDG